MGELDRKIIPIGPFHPLQEEAEFFKLHVEGEKVVKLDIHIGYLHRGIEKISSTKTWDMVPYIVERVCGICSASHPIAYVLAVENLLGIEPPPRAKYIRTIVGELERIHSHLLWVGLAGHFIGYNTVWMWAWKYREPVLDMCEMITGNRNHYAMMKPGGVRRDIEPDMISPLKKVLRELESKLWMLTKAVLDDPVLHARLEGVGVLPRDQAVRYCVVGPTARASGVEIDVRKDDPYDAYPLVEWSVVTDPAGDVFAKVKVRLLECIESVKIIRQCLDNLPKGEIDVKIEEVPPGEGIGRHEAPRGEVFHYVRSVGANTPYRHKIRAPSYVNIKSNEYAVVGYSIADAAITLAAVDPCYCCTDRMVALENGKPKYTYNDLLRLSWKKTEKIRERYKK